MALRFLCSLSMVSHYQKRISGTLLDRIDIHIEVPRVEYHKLTEDPLGEKSEDIRAKERALEVQCSIRAVLAHH